MEFSYVNFKDGPFQGALCYQFFWGAKIVFVKKMHYEMKKVPVAVVIAKRKNSRHVKFPGIFSMLFVALGHQSVLCF